MLQVQRIRTLHERFAEWRLLYIGTQWFTCKEARGFPRQTEAPRDNRSRQAFKLSPGRAKSPERDPPPRQTLPEWGSTDVKEKLVKEKEKPEKKTEEPKQKIDPKKDQQTLPQAAASTPKSDVRTLDKPRDLEKTSVPAEKKPCRGWLIPITINQTSTLALLDTGATCTVIGRLLYETLHAVTPLKLKTDEDLRLEVIGGGAAPTLGTATVQIGIAGGTYEQEVVVSANRENPNCILGSDFFGQHDCELSMRKRQFQVGDRQVRCVPEPDRVVKTGLKIARRVELPARME